MAGWLEQYVVPLINGLKNTPAGSTVYSGSVSTVGGTLTATLPTGWSATRDSTGVCTITHNTPGLVFVATETSYVGHHVTQTASTTNTVTLTIALYTTSRDGSFNFIATA